VRKLIAILFVFLAAFAASTAYAVQPDEIMSDPAKELRARDLSRELRCMVCQNQSIDDSEAPLARDLRLLVRERIAAGDSDPQDRFSGRALWRVRAAEAAAQLSHVVALAVAAAGVGRRRVGAVGAWPAPNEIRHSGARANGRRRSAAGTADRRTVARQAGLARP
jgi:hypothetical protein